MIGVCQSTHILIYIKVVEVFFWLNGWSHGLTFSLVNFFSCNGNKLKGSTELERPRINMFLLFFFYSLRVRGQHTKTTGRKGRTVGVAKKKN